MDDRVGNFLSNWVDANILNASREPDDVETLKAHYLTDAVAAGIHLDDVNDSWPKAEQAIAKARRAEVNSANRKEADADL